MFTLLSRIVNYGLKNFWRNGLLSTATVAIMTLALLTIGSLSIFTVIKNEALVFIKDKIDISVYFKSTTPEDEILNVKRSLESLTEVKSVIYISSGEALEIFREKHIDDQIIIQALNQLNENPLEAYLNIKAYQPEQYATIAQFLSSPRLTVFIDKVNYYENRIVIERLGSLVNVVSRGGLIITIVLILIAGVVVYNTVRLAIYSNRDEIGIMRVVGASNLFVRGPYMVEGIISGTLGALISMLILVPLIYFASPYVTRLVPTFNVFQYFAGNLLIFFFFQFLLGIAIGSVSSFVAVRRYLKN